MSNTGAGGRADSQPVSFLGRPVPANVERNHHVVVHGEALLSGDGWWDVLAVVEDGEINLETAGGATLRLVEGDLFTPALTGPVIVRAVHRRAVLAAVRHCRPDTVPPTTSASQPR